LGDGLSSASIASCLGGGAGGGSVEDIGTGSIGDAKQRVALTLRIEAVCIHHDQ